MRNAPLHLSLRTCGRGFRGVWGFASKCMNGPTTASTKLWVRRGPPSQGQQSPPRLAPEVVCARLAQPHVSCTRAAQCCTAGGAVCAGRRIRGHNARGQVRALYQLAKEGGRIGSQDVHARKAGHASFWHREHRKPAHPPCTKGRSCPINPPGSQQQTRRTSCRLSQTGSLGRRGPVVQGWPQPRPQQLRAAQRQLLWMQRAGPGPSLGSW